MKKVLIVVYAWPPAGGPGVQRCLKFVKYLPQFGWKPIVLSVENPETAATDGSLLSQIPRGLKIYKTRMLEPFTAYKKLSGRRADAKLATGHLKATGKKGLLETVASWVRLNMFVPDAKVGWWPYGVSTGKKIIKEDAIDLIFSSGPPHTTHLIARGLAKSSGLPWVADFRDPWVDIDYYHFAKRSRLSTWLDNKFESACLRTATATTTVSKSLVSLLASKDDAPQSYLLPNGYDAADLPKLEMQTRDSNAQLELYYGGSLSPDRTPHALIQAIANLNQADNASPILINLAGSSCEEFEQLLDQNGLSNVFNHMGYLPHTEASKKLVNADIALLIINRVPGNERIVTGKIFEYMGAGNPILGIGPIDGDAAQLLKETRSGQMFDYEDSEGISNFLKQASQNYPNFKQSFRFDCEGFSRENITKQLSEIFAHMTTNN